MMPRLSVKKTSVRATAMISPSGVTQFWSGITQSHGGSTAGRGGMNSKRPPEGEVEAAGTGQRVLALGQGMDAMERQAIRPAPDHDVAMEQRNAPDLSARVLPPQRKMAGKPSETDTIG